MMSVSIQVRGRSYYITVGGVAGTGADVLCKYYPSRLAQAFAGPVRTGTK